MLAFNRQRTSVFRFVRHQFDGQTGQLRLVYAFDQGPELVETLIFPQAPFTLSPARARALAQAMHVLHLFAGVSYYKAAVPPEIHVDQGPVHPDTAQLVESVYDDGLQEFAYCNQLDLTDRFRLPVLAQASGRAAALNLTERALVAIGGGKDSLVSIETLRQASLAQTLIWIGSSTLIANCATQSGLPTLTIARHLSPILQEMNQQGAWNGHVPVTAIHSAILTVAAVLYDFQQVVFSNEASASIGSHIAGVGEVNHQWSKGWMFEQLFANYVRQHISADLHYYSLLRPLSELAVARQFARYRRYDGHFSSCNRNFHLHGKALSQRWCRNCPKCRFVYLILAPFMDKSRLVTQFGGNLLNDPQQIPGFDALLEFGSPKPFECVGEAREARAAFSALSDHPHWHNDALVARFTQEIAPQLPRQDQQLAPLLALSTRHQIPSPVWQRVHAIFAT